MEGCLAEHGTGRLNQNLSTVTTGVVAGMIGFASSAPVVVQGLGGVGATSDQIATALTVLALVQGVITIGLSSHYRLPICVGWSMPGAALIAAAPHLPGGFADAVGAFLVTAGMIVACGLVRPLGRWIAAIPKPLANAMLAGILFKLCLAPVLALGAMPAAAAPVIALWLVMIVWRRLWAMPVALIATAAVIAWLGPAVDGPSTLVPALDLIAPRFSWEALIGIALPLFLVTMASQNIPGLAVLQANGYRPLSAAIFVVSGLGSAVAAPFGGLSVNLAAIIAALCAGPDAGPDPARRWLAALGLGLVALLFGILAGLAVSWLAAAPALLVETLAGLALTGALASALAAALTPAPADDLPLARDGVLVTFLVTASGVSFFGIGAAFWGLVAGGALWLAARAGPGR